MTPKLTPNESGPRPGGHTAAQLRGNAEARPASCTAVPVRACALARLRSPSAAPLLIYSDGHPLSCASARDGSAA
jgi:hypothetical protein